MVVSVWQCGPWENSPEEIIYQPRVQMSSVGLGPAPHECGGVFRTRTRPRQAPRSSAGCSGSVKELPIPVPVCAQLWSWLPEEGRHALTKSAKYAHPQLCCVPPRSSGPSTAQLLGSSSEQSGLRRAPDWWFVPSGSSFLCRPLKCSKHQKAGSLSPRQGPERVGLTLEQERE